MSSPAISRPFGPAGDAASEEPSFGQILRRLIEPFASLKLTVVLLITGLLLVLFGTLAQQSMNEFEAARNCFRTWFTWIELKWFFPKNFFPNFLIEHRPEEIVKSQWGFFFPGGWTIGGLMALNLLAAHGLRFKAQARGARLWAGLAVIGIGCLVTYWVIAAGPDKDGFETTSKLNWSDIHLYVNVLMAAALLGCGALLARWHDFGFWERAIVLGGVVLFGGATAFLIAQGDAALIKPEGIRILWQLTKGTFAALVLLAGCILAFRRRAAVVLLHSGLLLMMSNELVVYALHDENLLHVYEGETVNYVMSARSPELVLIDQSSPDEDKVTAIPISRLESGDKHQDDKLPCDIELIDWFPNSVYNDGPGSKEATAGNGLRISVEGAPKSTGANGSGENIPSAYVRFTSKDGKQDLGTYLLSYWFDPRLSALTEAPILQLKEVQSIQIDGQPFGVALRPKRTLRDYQLTLHDVRALNYVGTETARSYESDFAIQDARGQSREIKIWMNNPVRYAGETFYQSSYGKSPTRGEYSIFQVVRNEGWMIPYVACMIVVVGLLAQFGATLVRFLHRLSNPERYPDLQYTQHDAWLMADPWPAANWLLPLGAVLIPALALALWNRPRTAPEDVPDLTAAGTLPVAYEGRVKPWDSLARNSLRFISNREYFYDTKDVKQPAMRWLLDTFTKADTADEYKIFRIEAAELLDLFGLQQRDGFRYSFAELRGRLGKFEQFTSDVNSREEDTHRDFERRALDLDRHLKTYLTLRSIFQPPPDRNASDAARMVYLAEVGGVIDQPWLVNAPRALPTGSEKLPWTVVLKPMASAWMKDLTRAWGLTKPDEIAKRLVDSLPTAQLEKRLELRMLDIVRAILKAKQPALTEKQLNEFAREKFHDLPPELRNVLVPECLQQEYDATAQTVEELVNDRYAGDPATADLSDILSAYRDGHAERFNTAVKNYQDLLAKLQPDEYHADKQDFETYFNYLALFNTARWLYLIAFVLVACGWLGWMRPFNRAATALIIFTLLLHTAGLVGRIYISGRPPVTNLYSSAVFIGWAGVILGLILEGIYGGSFGNVIATVLGHITLAVADHLSLDGETLIVMQAVLDTNFWLATHVSCVTLGYTTTYVSGLLGLIYLILGMFTPALTPNAEKTLGRMIYGTACFGLFFSFFGTVLGGLWADDSWGRFWGWDPKENGALIIVLWNAVLLHARWDGWAKGRGLAILAIVGNIVTTWSWFGVNQLGIGRHSYGFTRGVVNTLIGLVLAHLVLAILGSIKSDWWVSFRLRKAEAQLAKSPPPVPKRGRPA